MDERAKEFLSCLGRGKSIYECEAENSEKDKWLLIRYKGKVI